MCTQRVGIALLLLLFLAGCTGMGTAPLEKTEEEGLSIAALFQTENGDALRGSAACFSTEAASEHCQVDSEGIVSVSGLPRSGELRLTLVDPQQKEQGAMTLSFGQGAVIDASTGENGVGHFTVRDDTSEVALIFVLTEDGTLQCTLWLEGTVPPNADYPQKGA